jgi:hypothetical protein
VKKNISVNSISYYNYKGAKMPVSPNIATSFTGGIVSYIALTFIGIGILFIFYSLPHVKEYFEKTVAQTEDVVPVKEEVITTRKEIDNFDLSIFNN